MVVARFGFMARFGHRAMSGWVRNAPDGRDGEPQDGADQTAGWTAAPAATWPRLYEYGSGVLRGLEEARDQDPFSTTFRFRWPDAFIAALSVLIWVKRWRAAPWTHLPLRLFYDGNGLRPLPVGAAHDSRHPEPRVWSCRQPADGDISVAYQ